MIIYKATNKINNKIYVGQTIYTLQYRKSQHERSHKYRNDMAITRAIKKYGKENFEWEVIDTADNLEELNQKESYWIGQLNSMADSGWGYNLKGGGGNAFLTEETKKKIGEAQKGELNHQYGVKGADCKHSKSVRNITDNIDYASERECSDIENIPFKIISAICNGKKGSYKGKQYKFIDENGNIIVSKDDVLAKQTRRVINLTTNKVYECVAEASKDYNDNCGNLSRQIREKGYCLWRDCKWKYEDVEIDIDSIQDKNYRSDSKKIMNLDTGEVFNSMNELDKSRYFHKLIKKGNGICVWRKQHWKLIE